MPEEFFDIYDENNNPLGISKPRSEVHANGDWHRAVHIWILNSKNELLIQKRASIKQSNPNLWDISAAGHISAGESAETSAIRELQEEIGIKVEPSELEYLFSITEFGTQYNGKYIDNEFDLVYLVHKDLNLNDLVLQKEEVSEVAWMPVSKLLELDRGEDKTFCYHSEEYKKLYEAIKN
jgi:isopentenyl-diphosphate delta-isomerase type 1